MRKYFLLFLVLVLTHVSGCASGGNKAIADPSASSQIINGKSTKADVIALLGEPNQVSADTTGREVWVYQHFDMKVRPGTFIPVIGLLAGGADTKSNSLVIIFDRQGVVEQSAKGQSSSHSGVF